MSAPTTVQPALEVVDVAKTYGSVTALRGVNLRVYPGEVVGLVGDNGAGKSTLAKILSGAVTPSSGRIFIDGADARLDSPHAARAAGIETVYQDLALAPNLSITSNLFLGREIRRTGVLGRFGFLDRKKMDRIARAELARLKIRVRAVRARCDELSGGQQQAVAVARAVAWGQRVIIMDEPTAALGVEEQHQVGNLVSGIRARGLGVVFISHNIPQVHELCDRIVVLYQGRIIANRPANEVSLEDVVMWITGARSADA